MSGRRGFLAGSAATVAASVFAVPPLRNETVAAATSPDAKLMGWCAALIAMEADWRQRLDVDENANRPAAYYSTLDAITDTPATTIDGNRAKLAAAASFYDPDPPGRSIVDAAMWDAIRALALPTVSVPAVVHDPDADLLALCADFADRAKALNEAEADLSKLPTDCTQKEHDVLWAAMEEVSDGWNQCHDEIAETQATTPAGLKAKAAVLRASLEMYAGDEAMIGLGEGADPHERLAWSLVEDMTGGAA